jgi:hypothetical protein
MDVGYAIAKPTGSDRAAITPARAGDVRSDMSKELAKSHSGQIAIAPYATPPQKPKR